jgi:predicted amidohydrolase YtcJ
VVEAYEAVNKEFDITEQRWVVHHVPEVNADLLTRLKALGVGVEMGAFRWVTSSDPKVVTGPPFRTIVDHGIQVGIHGDGVHIAPLNPWLHIYYAVTGVNSFGAKVNGDQQLTRQEALRSSRAATAGSCGWKRGSARLEPASSPISSCSTATTSPCRTCRSNRSSRC